MEPSEIFAIQTTRQKARREDTGLGSSIRFGVVDSVWGRRFGLGLSVRTFGRFTKNSNIAAKRVYIEHTMRNYEGG